MGQKRYRQSSVKIHLEHVLLTPNYSNPMWACTNALGTGREANPETMVELCVNNKTYTLS